MAQATETQSGRGSLVGTMIGVVTSDKRDKTRSVDVNYSDMHKKYGKYLRRSTRYQVHDEGNASKLGDTGRNCSLPSDEQDQDLPSCQSCQRQVTVINRTKACVV